MKRTVKALAVTTLSALVYSPAALAATNYPAIKPKGPKPDEASLGIFSWIVNNFPWVISGIAVVLIVAAIIRTTRDRARYRQELERRDRAAGN